MASFRKRGKGKVWYFRFVDADGVKREQRGCPDRRVTEELARAAESEVAKVRAGIVDPKSARHQDEGRRPLDKHVADWHRSLVAKGDTPKHAHMVRSHALRILGLARAGWIEELTPSAIQGALKALRDSGRSAQTCNHALRAIKGFSRWLHRDGRSPADALAHLRGFNVKADPRHERGALTDAEFGALCAATRAAGPFRGLSGADRLILYLTASNTGLRASELASLTTTSFDLDSDSPTVRVAVAATKNRQGAVLPVRPDLAALLRPLLGERAADAPVWPGTWAKRSSDMLRADLERAGIPYVDAEGRYRDFHSLRHRFGTSLALANVPPKVAQTLMRHSSITLTLDRYSHAGLYDVAGALDNLPPLPATEPEALRATGTDGRPISDRLAHYLPTAGDGSGRELAGRGGEVGSIPEDSGGRKPLGGGELDASGRHLTDPDGNTPGGTRTPNRRFRRRPITAARNAGKPRKLRHLTAIRADCKPSHPVA
jgi:integrase